MKKFLTMAALTLGIFFAQMTQAQAADVYAATEVTKDGKITDVYMIIGREGAIQKTNYGFKVYLYSIARNYNKAKTYWTLGFKVENNDLYAVLHHGFIDDATVQVTRGKTILSDYYFAIFKTAIENQ